jgi:hypothetical protein
MLTDTATPATGLGDLFADGLNLAALDDGAQVELLKWQDPARQMPDADLTVLLLISAADGYSQPDWTTGWWDGDTWRLCESGGVLAERVVAWAEPQGPRTYA